jgi:Protein of unknown function (DUF2934)
MGRTPSREEIEKRAYEIYEERGRENGHAEEHWLAAEQELAEQLAPAEPTAPPSRIRAAAVQAMHRPAAAGSSRP